MQEEIKRYCLIAIGWMSVILGAIGAFLPVLPTTPFLILACACFSKSSPRFHQMLLNNKWFGPALQEWEQHHTIKRRSKHRAILLIIVAFTLSIIMLWGRAGLQLMLVVIGLILLVFIYRLEESEPTPYEHQ